MAWLVFLFVITCVFDPADMITGLKAYLFGLLLVVAAWKGVREGALNDLPRWHIRYATAFIAIPAFSIASYYVHDGSAPFAGVSYFKAYVMVLLVVALRVTRVDILPTLSGVLAALAAAILVVFACVVIVPSMYYILKPFGERYAVFILDRRSYGQLTLLQIYFVASPMLVIPIAYYFDRAMATSSRRVLYVFLCVLSVAGMIAAGSRNNIFGALLMPALLWPLYTRRPAAYFGLSAILLILLAMPFIDYLQSLLDPNEFANRVRIGLLQDYARIFSYPYTLVFGRGLGAYEFWTARPYRPFSELTFLEIIRNFGVPCGLVMIWLLITPVASLWNSTSNSMKALATAYALFLVMSISNPLLFSSVGILVLCAAVAAVGDDRLRLISSPDRCGTLLHEKLFDENFATLERSLVEQVRQRPF